jgi:hypothetical protein
MEPSAEPDERMPPFGGQACPLERTTTGAFVVFLTLNPNTLLARRFS